MQGIDPAASIQQKEAASPIYKTPHDDHADLNTIANLSPSASGQHNTLHGCLQNSYDCYSYPCLSHIVHHGDGKAGRRATGQVPAHLQLPRHEPPASSSRKKAALLPEGISDDGVNPFIELCAFKDTFAIV